jgi:hypothetical protein
LCGGLIEGIKQMRQRTTKNEVASVLLFTDGHANVGYQTLEDIKRAMTDPDFAAKNDAVRGRQRNSSRANYGQMPMQHAPTLPIQATTSLLNPVVEPTSRTETPGEGKEVPLTCTVNTFGFGGDHGKLLSVMYLMYYRC